jgi:hypothetical protein
MAARPVRTATAGRKPSCRQNSHAEKPSAKRETGAYSFANHSGPSSQSSTYVRLGNALPAWPPTQFKSCHMPR